MVCRSINSRRKVTFQDTTSTKSDLKIPMNTELPNLITPNPSTGLTLAHQLADELEELRSAVGGLR